jgi:hypothetical protein
VVRAMISRSAKRETFRTASRYYEILLSIGFEVTEAERIVFQYTGFSVSNELEDAANSLAQFFDGVVINPHQVDDKVKAIYSMNSSIA